MSGSEDADKNSSQTNQHQRQLMIYERAVPVTFRRHAELSVDVAKHLSSAIDVNAVPVMSSEFTRVSRELPIVLAGEGPAMPVAVLGIKDNQNLMIDEKGEWRGTYVPAFLRQYPFVLAGHSGNEKLTLCIDEGFKGLNYEGRGERLFSQTGEQSEYLKGVVQFTEAYQRDFLRTRKFAQRLEELELLETAHANFNLNSGPFRLHGFQSIKREKLMSLKDRELLELTRSNALELVYAQLASLENFATLVSRVD
ncbi:SapC family protein [Falsiruegeria mediterranea]|jgi:SapC|uniref:SapC family protein n=1 Tax=Falsiruegeria mediterranea M17 TaxID=1200281 RepID=A0A2R8CEM9_9RHOB|nr:SapC family protein [Falsiruegeria mediterranea]SPJ30892.1 hypothetical protein TRM7615_04429 [Falsiruegeria mediterranea M17]